MAITTTFTAGDRAVVLDEHDWGKAMHAINEETGELDYEEMAPSWEELATAFDERQRSGLRVADLKDQLKAAKLEDDETQKRLIRLGLRMRRGRG
ncbi:MAG TPA: hypothetical protein VN837_04165 [Chloroflexota bacterium]|nr:hypothetical protein [Chloroflexota bacterium]